MKTTKRNQRRPNRKICERTETTPRDESASEREIQRLVLLLLLSRETQNTHLHFSSTKISSLYTTYALNKTQKSVKSKREKRETKQRERFISKQRSFYSLLVVSSRWYSALSNAQSLLKVLKVFHFGRHDGQNVGKFLRATRGV